MNQKLLLPVNHAKLTASWKTAAYRGRFGFEHYGVDMVSTRGQTLVYASGSGQVLGAGWDSILGYSLIIRYDRAQNAKNRQESFICRMFHFRSLLVRQGQALTKDTPLGHYGNTGLYSAGDHLHLELDKDLAHPFYTPTLSGSSTLFRGRRQGATDSTMENPMSWLWCKTTPPDSQSYQTAKDIYIRPEDWNLPLLG